MISSTFWILSLTLSLASEINHTCKCTPDSQCWPSAVEWSSLNQTLDGALIHSVPPGSVCYADHANYNPKACEIVASQWFNSTHHAEDPVSIDYPIWTDNSCNPIWPNGTSVTGDPNAGAKGCSMGSYPIYVVNATSAAQISETLKWASKKNIRVVIKSTGHSYSGRSIGYGSLSIWTHHLRGIEFIPDFHPASCKASDTHDAARLAAGTTVGEISAKLAQHNVVAVTGANPSVGIVGWLTGGGHGPLSQTYGMGADNLLEATIVTPDGQEVVTSPSQNSELFFAIRGGGGSTYGVVTEVVVKTYPSPKTTSHTFKMTSLSNASETEFYDFVGFLHAELQRLKDGGMQGYYLIVGPPHAPSLSLTWTFYLFDEPAGTVETLMKPIEGYLQARNHSFAYIQDITHADNYFDISRHATNEAVANSGSAYGSRLLSPRSLSDPKTVAKVFAEIGPRKNMAEAALAPLLNSIIIGHMIASPSTPLYYPDIISMNPAWRNTLVHLIVVQSWPDGLSQDLIDTVYFDITYKKTEALRRLSPETGAYFNEADSYEIDWQESFFGKNLEELKRVKTKFDPENVLWCPRCVGSENLVERDDKKLCKVAKRGGRNARDEPRRPGYYDIEGFGMSQIEHTEL